MKDILPALIAAVLIAACRTPDATVPSLTPTQPAEAGLVPATPDCISSKPAQKDIERVLSFAREVIGSDAWQQSASAAEGYAAVTWQNIPLSAVIYLEARIKPCGYTDADLDTDFSDENWRFILYNYESHEFIAACRTGQGLRLYQFKAQNQGLAYNIKYWVRSDSAHRVLTAMFVFPVGSDAIMDDYAARLFPDLAACSRE